MAGTHSLTHASSSVERNDISSVGKKQICDIGSGRDILPVLWPSFEGSLKNTKLLILSFGIDINVYKISYL